MTPRIGPLPVAMALVAASAALIFAPVEFSVGLRLRLSDIVLVPAILLFLPALLGRGVSRDIGPFVAAYGAFAVYVFCNGAMQVGLGTGIREALQLAVFAGFFVVLTYGLRHTHGRRWFLRRLYVGLWALAFFNAAYHLWDGQVSGWKDLGDMKVTHSVVLVLGLCLAALDDPPRTRTMRALQIAALLLAVVLLLLSGERKGWIAALAGAATLAILLVPVSTAGTIARRLIGTAAGIAVLGLLVAAYAPQIPYLSRQVAAISEAVSLSIGEDRAAAVDAASTQSNAGRLFAIEAARQSFRERPVFGIGPGEFVETARRRNIDEVYRKGAHNEVLRISAELGAVGLALYAVIHVVLLWRIGRLMRRLPTLPRTDRTFAITGGALLVFGFVINLFLAGGGLNTYLLVLPAALIYAVPLRRVPSPGMPPVTVWPAGRHVA